MLIILHIFICMNLDEDKFWKYLPTCKRPSPIYSIEYHIHIMEEDNIAIPIPSEAPTQVMPPSSTLQHHPSPSSSVQQPDKKEEQKKKEEDKPVLKQGIL